MEVVMKERRTKLIAKWALFAVVLGLGLLCVENALAAARVNEPPTIICNTCNLEVPYAAGATNDVRTTLGVLTWAANVGNVKYFPWAGPGAAVCREAADPRDSACIVYWYSAVNGLWTGTYGELTDSFCASHFNWTNWPYDLCAFDPPSSGAAPPQPINGPICIVDGIPKC
jgi:hypothetical protein